MTEVILTQDKLKEILSYNCDIGNFRWKERPSNRVKVGDIAGAISCGYRRISISGKSHYAHRLAWLYIMGEWPTGEIDHLNHNRDDNRFRNLREATHKENGRNQRYCKTNKTGYTGVFWYEEKGKYTASIMVDGKTVHGGSYDSIDEAIKKRGEMEREHDFHRLHGR